MAVLYSDGFEAYGGYRNKNWKPMLLRETRKLNIEIFRARHRPKQHLPLDMIIFQRQWPRGYNRFRHWRTH